MEREKGFIAPLASLCMTRCNVIHAAVHVFAQSMHAVSCMEAFRASRSTPSIAVITVRLHSNISVLLV